jgi:hypothetical protein
MSLHQPAPNADIIKTRAQSDCQIVRANGPCHMHLGPGAGSRSSLGSATASKAMARGGSGNRLIKAGQ